MTKRETTREEEKKQTFAYIAFSWKTFVIRFFNDAILVAQEPMPHFSHRAATARIDFFHLFKFSCSPSVSRRLCPAHAVVDAFGLCRAHWSCNVQVFLVVQQSFMKNYYV